MSCITPANFQRRPALIPSDVHLSSEDEQSILLRIGNLQLASLETRVSSSEHRSFHRLHSCKIATYPIPLIDATIFAHPAIPKQGSKRKASTTAEQYQELLYTVDEALVSKLCDQDHPTTEGRRYSYTGMPSNASGTDHLGANQFAFHRSESQCLSPKDRVAFAMHDPSFHSR